MAPKKKTPAAETEYVTTVNLSYKGKVYPKGISVTGSMLHQFLTAYPKYITLKSGTASDTADNPDTSISDPPTEPATTDKE